MDSLLIIFIILSIVNVVLATVKSIITISGGKFAAATINALYFGLYTVVVIYTMCDLDLWLKVAITAATNFVGVFVVKWVEEKARKDKLWKVECTIPTVKAETVDFELTNQFIPHNYIKISDKHTLFNCYCATQRDSALVKKLIDKHGAKYFVSETKNL